MKIWKKENLPLRCKETSQGEVLQFDKLLYHPMWYDFTEIALEETFSLQYFHSPPIFLTSSSKFSSSKENRRFKHKLMPQTRCGDTIPHTYTPHRMEKRSKVLIIKWRLGFWRKTRCYPPNIGSNLIAYQHIPLAEEIHKIQQRENRRNATQ